MLYTILKVEALMPMSDSFVPGERYSLLLSRMRPVQQSRRVGIRGKSEHEIADLGLLGKGADKNKEQKQGQSCFRGNDGRPAENSMPVAALNTMSLPASGGAGLGGFGSLEYPKAPKVVMGVLDKKGHMIKSWRTRYGTLSIHSLYTHYTCALT
jgi:hypothetical protein